MQKIKEIAKKILNFLLSFFTPCDNGGGWIYSGEFTKKFQARCYSRGISGNGYKYEGTEKPKKRFPMPCSR